MIVILVKFSDHVDRPVADASRFNTLFNVDGFDDDTIPTGSVKRFFQIQSAGKIEVTAYVEDWIVAPNSEEYYSFGNNGLDPKFTSVANGALDRMDARGTDWSLFDRDNVSNNCSWRSIFPFGLSTAHFIFLISAGRNPRCSLHRP